MPVSNLGNDLEGLVERLLAPDQHDPACPFKKHCYCDDSAPHDKISHPDGPAAAAAIKKLSALLDERIEVLREIRQAQLHSLNDSDCMDRIEEMLDATLGKE